MPIGVLYGIDERQGDIHPCYAQIVIKGLIDIPVRLNPRNNQLRRHLAVRPNTCSRRRSK